MFKELGIRGKVNFILLVGALFILMLGDLAQQIGSNLYWSIFFTFSISIYLTSVKNLQDKKFSISHWQVRSMVIGIFLILISMAFSSLLNSEFAVSTIKYLVKYVAMIVLSIVIFKIHINAKYFFQALRYALLLLGVLFIVSLILQGSYIGLIRLIDGRLGMRQAYPGMLWLSASIVLTYNYLMAIFKDTLKDALFLSLTLFLIFLDGSRTGLVFVILNLMFATYLIVKKKNKWLSLIKVFIVTILSFLSINLTPHLVEYFSKENLKPNQQSEIVVQDTNNYVNRIGAGDDYRRAMYSFALNEAKKFSFFGSGLENSKFKMEGKPALVIHNVYLQALIELGIVGLMGFVLIYSPIFSVFGLLKSSDEFSESSVEHFGLLGILLLYLLKGLFHPISNEVSVMGFLMMALAVLLSNSNWSIFTFKKKS